MTSNLDIHVVSHTHWDREWYHEAARFRQRLVRLVDDLLDDPPTGGASFLLDGQTVVLDDYLAVRPERAEALASLLRAGALEAGPWFVLSDELIPSGESLVRNLLAGRRALSSIGVSAPPVLYCPDSFGHPAALPAIAHGFGLPLVLLWRGYGGRRWPNGDTVRWCAPSGEPVVLFHLPPDGYEFGSSLPLGDDAAVARWARISGVLAPRSRLGVLLVQNGADHHARQPGLSQAVRALATAARPHEVRASSMSDFATALAERAAHVDLPEVRGELRDSYGYTWTLQGTFASRAAQKRRAAQAERGLLRDVEPWIAMAAMRGDAAQRERWSAVQKAAWRSLLLCHPHDTLCGCSTDAVARAMDARLDEVAAQAEGLRTDAIESLLGHDAERARISAASWLDVVVVRNRAARERDGVAEVIVRRKVADVPVGPGSAGAHPAYEQPGALRLTHEGRALVTQRLSHALVHDRIESAIDYPDADLVLEERVLVWTPPIPALGLVSLEVNGGSTRGARAAAPSAPARASGRTIENGSLRVSAPGDGSILVESLADSRSISSVITFESESDLGDLYTPSPGGDPIVASLKSARVVARGPLRATLRTRWALRVPLARSDERVPGTRSPRVSAARTTIEVEADLSLDAGASGVRIDVRGVNGARDHRLRMRLSTDVGEPRVRADAAFGPLSREPIALPVEDREREIPPATAPLHRYVSLFAGERGATLHSDGLAEYEATATGDIVVTLLRAVGELSRSDLPERPGHAGWPVSTPEAQSIGPFDASVTLELHGGATDETYAAVERASENALLPLTGRSLRSALELPAPTHGPELVGDMLALGAVKLAESGDAMILRCVNLSERPASGEWRFASPVSEAWLARLDETPLTPLELQRGDRTSVEFHAPPHGIVSILVR